jgi:hypothetical protein
LTQVVNAELVTSQPVKEIVVSDPNEWLSDVEKSELELFRKNLCKGPSRNFPVAQSTATQLFCLYLNGKTLPEIQALNPTLSMGQIVYAAVEGNWYKHRLDYLARLPDKAKLRLQQIACEAVDFMGDQLAAAHKMHGEAIQKYLQSGNSDDLGSFGINSIRQYREVLELLVKATGQNNTSTVNVKSEVVHSIAPSTEAPKVLSLGALAQDKKRKEEEELAKRSKK